MAKKGMERFLWRVKNRLSWEVIQFVDLLPFSPRNFSWKVRWRMKHDRNPVFIEVQDKFLCKQFAIDHQVGTAKLYFVTENPDEIPFDSLPANYFIKANHGCKWNILCKDNELFLFSDGEDLVGRKNESSHKITREECIQYCREWLKTVYSKREWAYQHIRPKLMVEEVLEQHGGGELVDYRCFTFNGKVKAVYVDSPTTSVKYQKIFVDSNWQELKIKNHWQTSQPVFPEKPYNFQKIIESAERLGEDFDFVRVDIYNTTNGIVLGEMSIYPMGGEKTQPTPDENFNQWLGDQWTLPMKGSSSK